MSEDQVQDTSFDCKLCGEKVIFNVNDSTSYLSVADEKKFAGMTLSTYRVTHRSGQENHTNAVTVDHKGYWRGLVDAYVDYNIKKKASELEYIFKNNRALKNSKTFEFLILMNISEGWVLDIICPSSLLPLKIGESIIQNLESIEDALLQESMLIKLDIAIGDKSFHTYLLGEFVFVFLVKNSELLMFIEDLFNTLFTSPAINNIDKMDPESFKVMVKILDEYSDQTLSAYNLIRVIEQGSILNPLKLKDKSRIPNLIRTAVNQKSIQEHIVIALISLLSGEKTLMELFESGYLNNFQEIFDGMDFIATRL